MTDAEIKKLIHRLKYLYAGRDDSIEAAKLIEEAYIGQRFQHKSSSNYTVVGVARLQFSNVMPQDGDILTLYRDKDSIYSLLIARPFNDGRFEPLNPPGYGHVR